MNPQDDSKNLSEIVMDNSFLIAIVAAGAVILSAGLDPFHSEMLQALGGAFIIAGSVGIYMMLATRRVVRSLHKRFDALDDTLKTHTEILKEIASSQKEMASSQKEMASSQNQNHGELMGVMTRVISSLEKIEKKL